MKQILRRKNRRLSKVVGLVGGFLIMAGTILLGIAILAASGFMTAGMLLEQKYLLIFALALVSIGVLNTFSAIVIARW